MEELIEKLKEKDLLIANQLRQNALQQQQIADLKFQLDELRRLIFGSKSEKFQPSLVTSTSGISLELPFGEVLKEEAAVQQETTTFNVTRSKPAPQNPPSRNILPDHLERVQTIIEPTGVPLDAVKIGELVTETLEYKPGKLFVSQTIRPKYALSDKSAIVVADMPEMPLYKCIAGASLLMRILVDKFVDHMPLYRQQQRFKRDGMDIPASTISGWLKEVAHLIEPLYDLLVKEVLSSQYIGADETHMKVLDKKLKGKTHQGYYWVYMAHQEKLIFFDYDPSRQKGVPGRKLKGFAGFLQTDGYAGYKQYKNSQDVKWLCCMAHARRKFEGALENDKGRSEYFLLKLQRLYRLEHWMRVLNIDHAGKQRLRERIAVPILTELKKWLHDNIQKVPPSEPITKAIAYTLDLWPQLILYTTDGRLHIDNNLVENKIRPVAIGRKNYMFMGSHESAQRSAMMYSFFASCALNNINPEEWLLDVITRIGSTKLPKLSSLLPNNWESPKAK